MERGADQTAGHMDQIPVQRLGRRAFAKALREGRGEAVLHAQTYGLVGVVDLVLAACVSNQAHDRQFEDSRGHWLYQLFQASPYCDEIAAGIIHAFGSGHEQRGARQLCDLAARLARNGRIDAAITLREFVWGQAFELGENVYGGPAIVLLDGLPAVIELARRYGRILQQEPHEWVEDLDSLTEDAGNYQAALAALDVAAGGDEAIATYLGRHRSRLEEEALPRVPENGGQYEQTTCDILAAALEGKQDRIGFYRAFGRHATQADLQAVYAALHQYADPQVCKRLLWVFGKAELPAVGPRIWEMARHADPGLRSAALIALGQMQDEQVGEYARQALRDPNLYASDRDLLLLLVRNFRAGDDAIILSALDRLELDDNDRHRWGFRVADVYDAHPVEALAAWVFHHTPCSHCRGMALDQMAETTAIPFEIAANGRFDADSRARKLAQQAYSAHVGS
jgi:hypothetical protein